jgi:hypothetical protein
MALVTAAGAGFAGAEQILATPRVAGVALDTDVIPATYVIWQNGSTFLARNGKTGNDDYSGTDATAVIQSAINALPSNGGLTFIKAGTYPITSSTTPQSPIGVPSGVVLQGEGIDSTIITSPQGFFYGRYPGTPSSSSQVSNIAIRDMTLQSNAPSGGSNSSGGYFFTSNYGANALRFERLKMLGGGNVGTGVVCFRGLGTPPGTYSNIQFIDVWADGQGTIPNEFFVFDYYNLSNIKFDRCYLKNTYPSGVAPTIGFFQVSSTVNTKIVECTLDTGVVYMNCGTTSLPITNRLELKKCHFTNGAQIGTGSPGFQWEEFYLSDCTSDGPLGVYLGAAYLVYLSNCWGYGTNTSVAGLLANGGNVIIRGGGLVDGWNTAGIPWSSGGSAVSLSTGNSIIADIDGFYIGKPANQTGPPGGFYFNYSNPPNASLKITDSVLDSSLLNVLNGQPGGPAVYGGLSSFVNLVNTGYMPSGLILRELTDLTGKKYSVRGIASITVTGSPFTYTNNDYVPEAIYIVGGTVSQISKNSVNLFTTSNVTVWLEPGESVTVTYSATPSMAKDMK